MIASQEKTILVVFIAALLLSSCGVSDYINSKKISRAPVYKAPAKSSQCEISEQRIKRTVNYINSIRAIPQNCGGKEYDQTNDISWNEALYNAAFIHSQDMAQNSNLSHTGSNNSLAGIRISSVGYKWRSVAENISGGTETPEQTIDRWMASSGHCHNIMNPAYTEIGMACASEKSSEYGVYWTLVLASPEQ